MPDSAPPQRPVEQPRHGPAGPGGRDAARTTRTLSLMAAIAAIMAIAIPPAGIALGIATLVVAGRNRSSAAGPKLSRQAMALSVSGGVFAIVVGGLLFLFSLLLGAETGQLRDCLAGANTRVAEQACRSEFMDAVQRRLIGG